MIHSNIIDFKQEFSIVKDYKFKEAVTRDNFTSFLIKSYELSRGYPEIQKIFFLWQEKLVHFKHWGNLEIFVKNGGFHMLKTTEQELFRDAFLKIEKHRKVFSSDDQMEIEMKSSLLKLRMMYLMSDEFMALTNSALAYFDFGNLKSFEDFRTAAAKYIEVKNIM